MRRWTASGRLLRGPKISGDETLTLVDLNEVRDALLGEEPVEAVAELRWYQRFIGEPWSEADPKRREECMAEARRYLEVAYDAAFPSTDSGRGMPK